MPFLKILLVEDYEPCLRAISLSLQQRAELQVFEASDGLEAVQKAEELQPDLILLDIGLPKLNGIEAAKRIRGLAPNAKLIFVSQESSSDVVRETFCLGAQGYVHKQGALSDLLPAIEGVLGGQRFLSRSLKFSESAEVQHRNEELVHIADATDLKKEEAARFYYDAIVKSSDDAIISKDLKGVISSWNSAAHRIFGHTAEEAIGQSITIIIPNDLREEENDILRRLRAGQSVDHCETRRVSKDGRTIDVSITVSPVKDAEGRIIGASKIARDITEKKRTDAAARESDERFRLAMNNVAAGVYTLDLQGLLTYVNPAAETMFGWTNAELLGRKMHDVTHYKHPDGSPFPASDCPGLQVLQKGTELRESEDMFIRKDGSFFPVVYSASPLKRGGDTVGIVVGFRDDTLRREAERAVRESEQRFRLVANSTPVMIWMSGVDKLCTYINQGWLEFTGRCIEAELGNGWAEGVHREDLGGCLETYNEAFDRREPFRLEYRLRRHDGEYRWIFDHGVPRFVDGSFAGYIGSCVDVTERKLAEEALSGVSQKLIAAQEEERTRLARELHDDISQRLAMVAMSLGKLKQGLPASDRELGLQIGQAIDTVKDLADDIQALSHRLHSSKLELLGLPAAAKSFCRELTERQGVQIDFVSENIPKGLQPESSLCLFRVLQEALQNATKHSGSRHFQVSLKGGAHEIELTVHDSGIGFEPEEAIKGHGLGLTSMKERLKLVRGQLSIDSKLGQGTTIRARVPLPKSPKWKP